MDPLSRIVSLLQPDAVFSKAISGKGGWGVRYGAHAAPGFGVVLTGRAWLSAEGEDGRWLERGDFVLFPTTPAFALSAKPSVRCLIGTPSAEPVRHGDQEGDADFEMLGGSFAIEAVNAPLLLGMLPRMIHISARDERMARLRGVIDLIMDECGGERPGRAMILARLIEVMLVEALRAHQPEHAPQGLLAGLRDPAIASALRDIHADVRRAWTIAELGQRAAMSRSAFAARFTTIVGCAPMEYLARWRMQLAQDALARGGVSLDTLAEAIGYESASAFSTAFRKRIGCAPGQFARQHAEARAA